MQICMQVLLYWCCKVQDPDFSWNRVDNSIEKSSEEDISVEDISVEDILEISSAELSSTELSSIEMSSAEMSSAVIRYNDYNSNTILLSPNTSWNKKINTQIPSFRLINPIIQSFCTTLRVYCISNPRVGFGYTIISYYSTSLVYIKPFLYHHFVLLYKLTVHQIQDLDLAIPSFRTTLRV